MNVSRITITPDQAAEWIQRLLSDQEQVMREGAEEWANRFHEAGHFMTLEQWRLAGIAISEEALTMLQEGGVPIDRCCYLAFVFRARFMRLWRSS